MSEFSVKKQTITGAFWKFSERILAQVVSFVISIILARLLAPDDYGLIALVFVFTTICDKLLICGFATSLIQKKDADDVDFSSVLFFSLGAAVLLYLLLFFGAPFIADFYNRFEKNELVLVIRVLGLSLFLVAFNSVQHAYVSKHMLFKRYFWSTLGGTIFSGTVGVVMAYSGFGVWALVAQNLLLSMADGLILFFTVRWRPKFVFSLKKLQVLFSYGWKIFTASIIKTLYNDLRGLVIAKVYTPSDLAFYNRGQSLPQLLDSNVTGTIDSVLFPAYSKLQNDRTALLNAIRRSIKTSCYILMPLLTLMAAVASPLVSVLLTDKWLPCVPYMQILCFSFMFSPIEMENLQAIKALGRSDIVLRLEVIKKVVGVVLLVAAIPFGMKAIAFSMLASCVISAVLNAWPNKNLLGYPLSKQLYDVLPSLAISMLLFVGVRILLFYIVDVNVWIQLLLSCSVGILFYLILSTLFNIESYLYMRSTIKNIVKK